MNIAHVPSLSVIIIGGGASGVLMAAHLLRNPDARVRVTLIEKSNRLGHGMAYGTENRDHVLNVPIKGMSAYPDDPEHFYRWLHPLDPSVSPDTFAPRARFGHYLSQLASELETSSERKRLHTVSAACTEVVETTSGVEVSLDDGSSVMGHIAVLALGHEERQVRGHDIAVRAGSEADTPLDPYAPVMVLGSGLSMVDAWLTLAGRHHRGPILVVSRNGMIPRSHARIDALALEPQDVPIGQSVRAVVAWFRQTVATHTLAGGDWRAVVDAMRPHTQRLWQGWSIADRARFLRHVRPLWNVHRHRLPPELHARLQAAIANSQITPIAGEFLGLEAAPEGRTVLATVRRRGLDRPEVMEVARVYDCGGVALNIAKSSNRVMQQLVGSGAARPDPLRIGLDVTSDCALLREDGTASRRLFAVGPLTRSQFFEIEAVPDIRVQTAALADRLLAGAGLPAERSAGR